jgi:hypothetical protein
LKVGAIVCFNGVPTDLGKVAEIQANYVTIKWDDGHESITGHVNMRRVELVRASKAR